MNLARRWLGGCEVVDKLTIDAMTKLMPRQLSNHVKDRHPDTAAIASKLADDFVRTRGWNYNASEKSSADN